MNDALEKSGWCAFHTHLTGGISGQTRQTLAAMIAHLYQSQIAEKRHLERSWKNLENLRHATMSFKKQGKQRKQICKVGVWQVKQRQRNIIRKILSSISKVWFCFTSMLHFNSFLSEATLTNLSQKTHTNKKHLCRSWQGLLPHLCFWHFVPKIPMSWTFQNVAVDVEHATRFHA